MRPVLLVAFAGLVAGSANAANDWVNLLVQDPTGGLTAGHICYSSNGHDVSCDSAAPSVSGTAFVVSGTVSATAYYGDGSHLTGVGAGDRIVSGTLAAIANSGTGYISLTTAGTDWGYFSGVLSYLPTLSMTTAGVSNTLNYGAQNVANVIGGGGNWIVSGSASVSTSISNGGTIRMANGSGVVMTISGSNVGIGTTIPSATLHVKNSSSEVARFTGNTTGSGNYIKIESQFGSGLFGTYNNYPAILKDGTNYAYYYDTNNGASILAGNVGIGTATPENLLSVGAQAGQSNALITARGGHTANQNALEWGNPNTSGYGSVLGSEGGSGAPFICFDCEAGTTVNTYRTRGIVGAVLMSTNDGGFLFAKIPAGSADNQSRTQTMSITSGGILVVNGSTTCTIGNGTGATNCTSDRRLKTDIAPIQNALAKLALLKGVTFHWKDPKKSGPEHIGVIAQDVEKVFPQAVGEVSDTTLGTAKTVDIAALVAPLIEAVKDLKVQNDDLQRQINELKAARQ